jgi:hypothetical protein
MIGERSLTSPGFNIGETLGEELSEPRAPPIRVDSRGVSLPVCSTLSDKILQLCERRGEGLLGLERVRRRTFEKHMPLGPVHSPGLLDDGLSLVAFWS